VSALRIGVIGYGYWGPNLVRNFASGPRTKVVAIAEQAPHRRQVAQTQYPYIRVVEDAAALIADPDIDAVAIATPIFTHYELAKRALEAGKHVLVEKPLTPSFAQAEELAALAVAQNRVLMVDHTFVYTGAVKKIR
jgi:predicted dehydrogenase